MKHQQTLIYFILIFHNEQPNLPTFYSGTGTILNLTHYNNHDSFIQSLISRNLFIEVRVMVSLVSIHWTRSAMSVYHRESRIKPLFWSTAAQVLFTFFSCPCLNETHRDCTVQSRNVIFIHTIITCVSIHCFESPFSCIDTWRKSLQFQSTKQLKLI